MIQVIDAINLAARLEQGEGDTGPVFLLDVREPDEWEICHIHGAVLVPLGEIPARLHEIPQDRPVIAYCHHGRRSEMALRFLQQNGYEKLYNLAGGIAAWADMVDPAMTRY